MKISKETLTILKNFSGINPNLLIKAGSRLSTISAQKNVMAEVTVAETFPVDFGIYDLSKFLGIVSLFDDADIDFTDKVAKISEGKERFNYHASDRNVLTLPPEKKITFPKSDIDFELPVAVLTKALRSASVLQATDISIVGSNGVLSVGAGDLKNPLADDYLTVIGETDLEFRANLKVDNLKMIQQDYNISISSKKISRWVATQGDMTIFVALESTSTF